MSVRARDESTAVVFDHVSKRYLLGGGPRQLLLEAFGLTPFLGTVRKPEEFLALDDVTFDIRRGERVGIIGRNGAGKTTLLKLIAGNYAATGGSVLVNGCVQALMIMGQGFHPDYTGRDNINASLQYNGLSRHELKSAFEDVVEFCELGPFLGQPFKTYSSGMQARLMFAVATAIKPEILIIDEVLGAGDAYFLAKSKQRIERLVGSGCTLLLVSHSMAQVLELCARCIWLDGGRVRADGEAFPIVKAYEETMYGALPGTGDPLAARRGPMLPNTVTRAVETIAAKADALPEQAASSGSDDAERTPGSEGVRALLLQQPAFRPHARDAEIPTVPDADGRVFRNIAPGGISRWANAGGLRVTGLSISGPSGPTDRLVTMQCASVTLFLEAERDSAFCCTYGLAIHDLQGRAVSRCYSPPDHFTAKIGEGRRVEMTLNPLQIGPGIYTLGVSVLHETTIEDADSAGRYDLLSRSFVIEVAFPDSMSAVAAEFMHTSEWAFAPALLPAAADGGCDGETSADGDDRHLCFGVEKTAAS
jgi:lipopolysaccharide transport system ATP-binding protein